MWILTRVRWLCVASLIVGGLVLSTGCSAGGDADMNSGTPPPNGEAYRDEIDSMLASEKSEFVRAMLSDYSITEEEYSEAQGKLKECMVGRGIDAEWQSDDSGGTFLNYHPETGDAAAKEAVYMECWNDWIGGLQSLYEQILANPNNEDRYMLVAECLVRVGLAPEGFSADELRELEDSGAYRMAVGLDDEGNQVEEVIKSPTDPDPVLPGGEPVHGGAAEECWARPLEAGIEK